MGKNYTQSTASLKTVTHDTFVLDAQKIMIYPGSGDRGSRVNIIDTIKDTESKITNVSLVVSDVSSTLNGVVNDVAALETVVDSLGNTYVAKTDYNSFVSSTNGSISTINTALEKCAKTNTANTFSANNTFNAGFQALPLGTTTVTGQPAYGISVTPPSADRTSGGLQLWGVQFAQGDEWSDNALKIVHTELALFGNHQAPCSLTFDNANVVNFKVMPDDGSTANNGQGAIFDFQGWQWDNDSHTSKNANCPVQILKNNAGELVDRSLLNKSELDARYAQLHSENTLTETNTFEKTIIAEDGINATSGDIVVSEGVITFEDLIDGTVVERSGATGYQYVEGMPTSFENGVCYDIGEISNATNLSNVKFTAEGRLVQTCELWFKTPATVPTTHKWPTNIYWIDSATGAAPTLIASKNYRLVFRQEPNKIIASIAYLY